MNAIIIEDEKLAAERLEEIISEADPSVKVIAKLSSVKEAVKWLVTNKPDLIFLDIQLSDGLSFSIFDQVEVNAPIIFTTAYDQYAVRAFKLYSVDYLLKPVRKSELSSALSKLKNFTGARRYDFEEILKNYLSKEPPYKSRFLIQYGSKIKKVETTEAAYFFAEGKSVFMRTVKGEILPVDYSLDKLQELLDPDEFFRINRKMIVGFRAIKNLIPYSRSRVKLELDPPEPKNIEALVSVERAASFKEWMDK